MRKTGSYVRMNGGMHPRRRLGPCVYSVGFQVRFPFPKLFFIFGFKLTWNREVRSETFHQINTPTAFGRVRDGQGQKRVIFPKTSLDVSRRQSSALQHTAVGL